MPRRLIVAVGATLAVLVFAVCMTRIVCDTLEIRYQEWFPLRLTWMSRRDAEIERYSKGLPRPIVSGAYTPTAPSGAIEGHAELRRALAMLQITRNAQNAPFPSVRTDLNLPESCLRIPSGMRMAAYADEPGHPFGSIMTQVALAMASAWGGTQMGRRLEIDLATRRFARDAPKHSNNIAFIPCLSTKSFGQVLRAVRWAAWWMPACAMFAWYATFDRVGINHPYGSLPYSGVLWNGICWGTWSCVCALTYIKVAARSDLAPTACLQCGYSLKGLTSRHCPECGVLAGTAKSRHARLMLGFIACTIWALTVGLGVRGASTIMGCQELGSSEQSAETGHFALDASPKDRLIAWVLMSPVAPIRPRATFLGSLFTPRDERSN